MSVQRDRFLRQVKEEELRWKEHRVRIRFDGRFQAVCSCVWRGPLRETRDESEQDRDIHVQQAFATNE